MYAELARNVIVCSKCKSIGERYYKTDSWYKHCKKQYIRDYQRKHKHRTSENKKNYVLMNKDKVALSKKTYRETHRTLLREKSKAYMKKNSKECLSRCRLYRAKKVNATPKRLTMEHLDEIRIIYSGCPKKFHVDHIVPLRGRNISGLHVPWNLQYLSQADNLRKSNKS